MLRSLRLVAAFALAAASTTALASGPALSKKAKSPTPAASKQRPAEARNDCPTCLERRVVLDPTLFSVGFEPDVRPAYEAARKYPDLIDRIHCFCECKESQRERHKTLLTCYTDRHAAGCGICQREAILAAKMKDAGSSDDDVEITVESLHKTDGHPPTFGRGN